VTAPRLHHASLTVTDVDPAIAFFGAVFGYAPLFVERGMADDIAAMAGRPGLACDFAQLRADGSPVLLELIAFHPAGEPRPEADALPWRPGAGHVAVHVDDFSATLAAAVAAGARVLGRPIEFPGGRAVYCVAPGGAFFEIEWLQTEPLPQEAVGPREGTAEPRHETGPP